MLVGDAFPTVPMVDLSLWEGYSIRAEGTKGLAEKV